MNWGAFPSIFWNILFKIEMPLKLSGPGIFGFVLFRPHHWQAWALHYWGRRIWEQKKHVQYFPTRQFLRSLLPQHPSIQLKVDDQEYWPKMRIHIWIWIPAFPHVKWGKQNYSFVDFRVQRLHSSNLWWNDSEVCVRRKDVKKRLQPKTGC